jgi:hypothetical protein
LRPLRSLSLLLQHPAWAKACVDLGACSQLTALSLTGRPLDEAAKHGVGAVSAAFWASCIAPLHSLHSLHLNPWIQCTTETGAGQCCKVNARSTVVPR